jgi:hypothetical protein
MGTLGKELRTLPIRSSRVAHHKQSLMKESNPHADAYPFSNLVKALIPCLIQGRIEYRMLVVSAKGQ